MVERRYLSAIAELLVQFAARLYDEGPYQRFLIIGHAGR